MSSPTLEQPPTPTTTGTRLFVAWQHPDSRTFSSVGVLERLASGEFAFRYLNQAQAVEGFAPFLNFPALDQVYRSSELFPFFTNRVISPSRGDFGSLVESIGLVGTPEPYEILVRSGGKRETDTVEVFPAPVVDRGAAAVSTVFLARGVRHLGEAASQRIRQLAPGDTLDLAHEFTNHVNNLAVQLQKDRVVLGYVPDYLVPIVHEARRADEAAVTVTVMRANPPSVAPHMRLLCRFHGRWTSDRVPFNDLLA